MINQGEILTLNNNKEYVVVSLAKYNEKNYVYLINQDDYKEIMFCEYNENKLEEITDNNLIEILMEKFKENIRIQE